MLGRINLLKLFLPLLFLFFVIGLVKIDIINVPDLFSKEDAQTMAQDPPFRGLGKSTLDEEFNIFFDDKSLFPERLGDMHLVKVIKGEEALANVQSFQGTTIDIARAYIPHYQIGNRQVIIWITESHHEKDAAELIERMSHTIPNNEKFHNFDFFYTGGIKVYQVERMGWFNYFYQKENGVYWVSIQDDTPNEVLSWVLEDI